MVLACLPDSNAEDVAALLHCDVSSVSSDWSEVEILARSDVSGATTPRGPDAGDEEVRMDAWEQPPEAQAGQAPAGVASEQRNEAAALGDTPTGVNFGVATAPPHWSADC